MSRPAPSLVAAGFLFVSSIAPGQTTAAGPPLSLQELERRALENNPTIAQASAEVAAARGRAVQGGLLPNPRVGYSFEEVPFRSSVTNRGKQGFFIEQAIPLGGKLRLARRVFEKEVDEGERNLEAQRGRVLNSVRALYYQALAAARRVEVRERLAQLSSEAVIVTSQLFNTGAADRPDLLEAEVEDQRARIDLVAARNGQFMTWIRLGTMIGSPTLKPQALAGSLDEPLPELQRERLQETLLRESPQLKSVRARLERDEAALKSARRQSFPDLFLRGGAMHNRESVEGTTGRHIGWEALAEAGISVPLFNRNQGNIAAAEANVRRSRAELARFELQLGQLFGSVYEDYLTSIRTADVYRTEILPRAERAYELYLMKFKEISAAYPQVLIAQRTLIQSTESYLAALERVTRSAVQLRNSLLMNGLEAPPKIGEGGMPSLMQPGEIPGMVQGGETPGSVRTPGN